MRRGIRVITIVAMLFATTGVPGAVTLWGVSSAWAAPCTAGVDCYCDKVRPGGSLYDPSLLFCEDWEAPTLHDDVGVGNGAPYYGPWYDDTGFPGARGYNSYLNRKYGTAASSQCNWQSGQPASPTRGHTCTFPQCFDGAWSIGDQWQANSTTNGAACVFIPKNGEFNAEISDLTSPTNTVGGVAGVFDGKQSFAHRVAPNISGGVGGNVSWSAATTFGVTMALAYPINSDRSGIWRGPWKHNEWISVDRPGGNPSWDGIFLFHNVTSRSEQDPFYRMFVFNNGDTETTCQAKLNAATKTVGDFLCNSVSFQFGADPAVYVRSRDWPDGTWGCVQGYYQTLGARSSIQVWFTTSSGVQKKIIDISNMDLSGTTAKSGYSGLFINSYANANAGIVYGYTPTTETTYRYEDNIHIRAGFPVSCAQIGFSATPGIPSAPSGLTVR